MLLLLTLLVVKHFVLDFLYQPPYQWMNKGTYGHLGGVLHSFQHVAGTLLCLLIANPPYVRGNTVGFILVLEYVAHYHIDWAKMNLNKKMGWTATTHNEFWILLGVDQLLHYLTYCFILYLVF
jgi:hypothetical protein